MLGATMRGASTSLRWARALGRGTVLLAATLAACDVDDPSDDPQDATLRDARAVAHGSGSLDGAPRLVYLAGQFALPPGLDASDPTALLRNAVAAVHARLSFGFAALDCEATIDTDGQARVSLALTGCTLLLWSIDAELEAVARVETEACDTGTCAVAVLWDVDMAEVATGLRGVPPARFSGPAELRAPVEPSARMQWRTLPGFVIETPLGRRFESVSTASWSIGADDCVELDLGARLSLEPSPGAQVDALDEQVGDVVVSARGLRRCPGQCPASGRVELSFGAGQVLAWTHDGSGTILVQGPRGRELEAQLPCAQEASAGG
jgi:hypothetical protein